MSLHRRNFLKSIASAVVLGATAPLIRAQEQAVRASRGMPAARIKDISVIECQPQGVRLTVVKITTDQDGLYGYGCATFTQRAELVKPAVEKYLKPFLLNKTTDRIEDIWQSAYLQEYFRSGPEGNDALSGIDGALWDILGKRLGVPVYQLLGGKVRAAVPLYGHASALTQSALNDQVQAYIEKGYQVVRIQLAVPGWSGYGVSGAKTSAAVQALRPDGVTPSPVFDAGRYLTTTIGMFEAVRAKFGFDIGLVHDIHERPAPNQSIQLCRAVEQYRRYLEEG